MKNSIIKFRYSIIALLMIVLNGVGALASAPWTVNPSDYQYDMSLYLDVSFVSGKMDYSKYDVGAFCGDECRGIAQILPLGDGRECLYLRARSNQESGETMTYKYYNKETEEIKSIEEEAFKFEANSRLGYPSAPISVIIASYFEINVAAGEGGSIDQSGGRLREGTALTIEATPSKGYHFEKWSDGNMDNPRTIIVEKNLDLKAEFDISFYKLIYSIDGNVYKEYDVTYGTEISSELIPEITEKEGYTFSGWHDIPKTMPDQDVEVQGSYTINSYKLTYLVDGEMYKEVTVEFGTAITAESAPTKEGYTFSGWEGLPETMPAKDVTVKGSFSINSYKAVFKIGDEVIETKTVAFGSAIDAPDAPTKEGYTFAGWQNIPETMPAKDIEILGSYTVNQYKLTYIVDGETYKEVTVDFGTAITAESAPTKEGYTFSGWEGLPETMPAEDVTVTGSFTINSYNAVFKIDDEVIETKSVTFGSTIEAPEAPTKEGYTFAGWQSIPETMPAKDIEIFGSYTINQYKLTYIVDEETYKEVAVDFGTAITTEAAPTKEGYTFSGWEGLPETMPAKDVTVTGSFSINSYKAMFKIGDEVIGTKTVAFGSAIEVPEAPTKEGYTFAGWQNIPETMPAKDIEILGSYTVNQYKLTYMVDGETYKEVTVDFGTAITAETVPTKEGYTFSGWEGLPETMPAKDVTVTGSFAINSYKAVFKIGDEVIDSKTVAFGSAIEVPEVPAKEGYTFAGWQNIPETMPSKDIEILGSYTVNQYKLIYIVDGETYKDVTVDFGTAITAESAPTKEGYTFSGWEGLPETMPAKDVTVTGSFSINSYKAVFKIGDELIDTKTVIFGSAIEAPEAPAKEGYTFAGWQNIPETMPAKDIDILGTYTVNQYKLTYIVDGETYKEVTVAFGTAITAETVPTKEGYTFSGWEGLPETMPAKDVTVTGSFSINSYKAVFKIGDEVIETKSVAFGSAIDAPEAPAKEGYTFTGWQNIPETMPAKDIEILGTYTVNQYKLSYIVDGELYKEVTVDFGTAITAESAPTKEGYTFSGWEGLPETMPAHDVTVSGTFSVNSYTVVFKIDGEVIATKIFEVGQPVIAPDAPVKEGYTFVGWQNIPETMPAKDIEILGSYTVNQYKLSYIVDGETYKEVTVDFGTAITVESAPTKEGYTFSGWEGLPETMPAHDVTVSGTFSVNSYTVVFTIDGEVIATKIFEVGQPVIAPDAPVKEGYTFVGWQNIPETMPAKDIEILGSYTVNQYKLTYIVDGETYKEVTVDFGTAITAESAPTKEGYTFSGWEGLPETMPAHDVTVSGTFSVNSYTAVFRIDGEVIATKIIEVGQPVIAPDAPAKEGYTFAGWQDLPETMPAKDIEILGTYTVNQYKLTYIVDGETYKELTVDFGSAITAESAPTKEGYTFSGWEGLPETMPAHDVTVSGTFSVNSYTVVFKIDGEVIATKIFEVGQPVIAPDAPAKEGYTFVGWQNIPETMPSKDIEISGSYTVNQYKLTYTVDGETYKEVTVDFGTVITAATAPTKEGYTFTGWEGLPETMPARDVTINGTFIVNKYKLTIYLNDEEYSSEEIEFGTVLNIENPAVPEGNVFDGWTTEIPEFMPAFDLDIYGTYTLIDGITSVYIDIEDTVTIYTINGSLICKDKKWSEVADILGNGLYIINGKKTVIRR